MSDNFSLNNVYLIYLNYNLTCNVIKKNGPSGPEVLWTISFALQIVKIDNGFLMGLLATQLIIGEEWSIALFMNMKNMCFKITNQGKLS